MAYIHVSQYPAAIRLILRPMDIRVEGGMVGSKGRDGLSQRIGNVERVNTSGERLRIVTE